MKLHYLVGAGALAAVTVAALAPKALYVNGKKSAKGVIEQNGEVYIPASALSASGADVAINDTRVSVQFKPVKTQNEQEYVEGIVGEWVSNGVWRIRVSNLEKIENPVGSGGDGWAIDLEAKNTSSKMVQMAYSGVLGIQIVDGEDHRFAPVSGSFDGYFADIQPGGSFKNRLKLGGDNVESKEATKLIVQFGKPLKSVRINLKP